nr:MAG TPA: Tudor domain-containing protein [Caudoviricetes sp.]
MVLVIFVDYDKFFKVANSDLRKLNKNLQIKKPLRLFYWG